MTLRHLEIFSAVCAQESFTRAAEQLNMAQPAVSLAIRELEVFYNVRLFERMNRRGSMRTPCCPSFRNRWRSCGRAAPRGPAASAST
mgnify:CR=1 FL=1